MQDRRIDAGQESVCPGGCQRLYGRMQTDSFPCKRRGEANGRKLSDLPVARRTGAMTIQPIRSNKNRSWASSLGMAGMPWEGQGTRGVSNAILDRCGGAKGRKAGGLRWAVRR